MLPRETALTLIIGVLQKDVTLALLVSIAETTNLLNYMTKVQLFIFSLFSAVQSLCIIGSGRWHES